MRHDADYAYPPVRACTYLDAPSLMIYPQQMNASRYFSPRLHHVVLLYFQHLFRASPQKFSETNPERALVVPAGSDSLDAILKATPPGTRREDFLSGNAVAEGAMGVWKRAVEDVFGAADLTGGLTTPAVPI